MMSLRVQPLCPDDAAAACAVIHAAFAAQSMATDPPSAALAETEASIAGKIAGGGGAGAVAPGMVGVVLWEVAAGGLYLGRLAVLPGWRGRGLARALLAAAEAEALARALPRLHLSTRLVLEDNRRLFASAGFVEIGRQTHPGYCAPTSVVMEKRLAAHRLSE